MPKTTEFKNKGSKRFYRSEAEICVSSEGKVYVIGGRNHEEYFDDIGVFASEEVGYQEVKDLNVGKRGNFACVQKGYEPVYFIFGGRNGDKTMANLDMHQFDADLEKVTKIGQIKAPLTEFAAVYDTTLNGIWVFGGSSDGTKVNNDLLFFDCKSFHWKTVASKGTPSPRKGHCMSFFENSIFLYGGTDEKGTVLEDTFKFDVKSATWQVLSTDGEVLPGPRTGAKVVRQYHLIYLFGGAASTENRESFLYFFNVFTHYWDVTKITGGLSYTRQNPGIALDIFSAEPQILIYGGYQPHRKPNEEILDRQYSQELFSVTGIPTFPLLKKSLGENLVVDEEPKKKRARKQLRKRKLVAAKVKDDVIFARIIRALDDGNRYEVEDADNFIEEEAPEDEENKLPDKYTVNREDILKLPGNLEQHNPHCIGEKVLALYPGTSTFYPAEVKGIGNEGYYLLFDGEEEGEKVLREVSFKFVTQDSG